VKWVDVYHQLVSPYITAVELGLWIHTVYEVASHPEKQKTHDAVQFPAQCVNQEGVRGEGVTCWVRVKREEGVNTLLQVAAALRQARDSPLRLPLSAGARRCSVTAHSAGCWAPAAMCGWVGMRRVGHP